MVSKIEPLKTVNLENFYAAGVEEGKIDKIGKINFTACVRKSNDAAQAVIVIIEQAQRPAASTRVSRRGGVLPAPGKFRKVGEVDKTIAVYVFGKKHILNQPYFRKHTQVCKIDNVVAVKIGFASCR